MFPYQISFVSPGWLLLLLCLPLLWWYSGRRLRALGPLRSVFAILLRSLVITALVFALAEVQMVRVSDRLTVVYLLDQSMSIPEAQRKAMIDLVNQWVLRHRREDDRAGVIVFGRDAAIEVPPFNDDIQMPGRIESLIDRQYTNLAAAMKLAQASFPEGAAKRIVVISDGNENVGSAVEQAKALAGTGVAIDAVTVRYATRAEVAVERLTIPPDVRRGQPFDMKVVVNNTAKATASDPGLVRGTIRVTQKTRDGDAVLSEEPVELAPGKRVFTIRQQIDAPDFYTYEVRYVPDRPSDDTVQMNNRATAFTHVRGKGQVLLIEDYENPGEFNLLVAALRRQGLEVTLQPSNSLFTNLAELQPYDAVILANVPRSTNENVNFTDEQIKMLVRNTQQMGSGLVMIGGPNSFGAGGWTNTEVEKAMPVDFQIKSAKVLPRGALVMLMHASEIPEGNFWQKKIAGEAIRALSAQDYAGLIHWSGQEAWLWKPGLRVVGDSRGQMLSLVDRMTPGDMPDFDPSLRLAEKAYRGLADAAVKHMIVISDGDPSPPSTGAVAALQRLKVTVSTVAVGAHGPANSAVLRNLATATKGKYYEVKNNNALPRIFQREARRVARPLIYESKPGFQLRVKYPHEMISGIDSFPLTHGFVMTSLKENPLVETVLVSPLPPGETNSTLLAGWTYGLGKAVAFTSDAGVRWTNPWASGWPDYDKFWSQVIRWSMRPTGDTGKFTVSMKPEDGRVQIVVSALDKDDQFLNFLDMSSVVVGPDLEPRAVKIEQTAPGRYVGSFEGIDPGSYFVMISPGPGMAPIRTGVNVPYSDEFRDHVANPALMEQLAAIPPKGGPPGKVIDAPLDPESLELALQIDPFRRDLPKATSSQDIWPFILLAGACLFFADIFTRRVHVGFGWLVPIVVRLRDRILGRESQPQKEEYMGRLRSRKAEVSEQIEQRRSAARFEMPSDAPPAPSPLEETPAAPPPPAKGPSAPGLEGKPEEESYTERLLKAKKKVWEDRKKPDE